MVKREVNLRLRVGMRVLLECNKGKFYFGDEICNFLNPICGFRGSSVDSKYLARLVKLDKANNKGVLYPVTIVRENNRNKYGII